MDGGKGPLTAGRKTAKIQLTWPWEVTTKNLNCPKTEQVSKIDQGKKSIIDRIIDYLDDQNLQKLTKENKKLENRPNDVQFWVTKIE